MRCKSCNGSMQYSPFWVKLPDGIQVENDICVRCTHAALHPDHISDIFTDIVQDGELIKSAIKSGLRTDYLT